MRLIEIAQVYRIYLDLDGVLADFHRKMGEVLGEPYSEERYESDPKYRKQMWKALKDYQKKGGEWWYDLDLMPDALTLWNYVKKHDVEILSAAGDSKYKAEGQKVRWVREKLDPNLKVNVVRSAADKQRMAGEHYILIDDKEKALGPWRAAGGIGILHTSAANTINQLKQLGL